MKGIYWFELLGMASFQAFIINPCFAQSSNIVPDNSLGMESSQVVENIQLQGLPVEEIKGGARRGINLFHSFREFNVREGRGAYFLSPNAEIQNILARVTGNNRSDILGTLGTFGHSQPNLFLINPSGILFGEKASLDVGGSFVATTANGLQFGEQGLFTATIPEAPPLLTVNPSALWFNRISSGDITVRSMQPTGTSPSGIKLVGLRVPDSRSLLLVGGNVIFEGGQSSALGGRIELGGLKASGSIALQVNNQILKLNFPQNISLANASLPPPNNLLVALSTSLLKTSAYWATAILLPMSSVVRVVVETFPSQPIQLLLLMTAIFFLLLAMEKAVILNSTQKASSVNPFIVQILQLQMQII
ncbi:filamentous hemagglutinin N-terminal domain-containing protein [Rivularia sp. PCC 7116]|uniref:filamentous hemagglutinin N-terminal domain-containing protein n=1 Tax=Rivularia sp. PCC 7116 TaxID=373994 RepID=UPI0002F2C80A|nr:filamentous hemagglutinin N-terminal domain-containing protein [Rivularia sp. PCC 7116]